MFIQVTGTAFGIPEQQSNASPILSSAMQNAAGQEDSLFASLVDDRIRQSTVETASEDDFSSSGPDFYRPGPSEDKHQAEPAGETSGYESERPQDTASVQNGADIRKTAEMADKQAAGNVRDSKDAKDSKDGKVRLNDLASKKNGAKEGLTGEKAADGKSKTDAKAAVHELSEAAEKLKNLKKTDEKDLKKAKPAENRDDGKKSLETNDLSRNAESDGPGLLASVLQNGMHDTGKTVKTEEKQKSGLKNAVGELKSDKHLNTVTAESLNPGKTGESGKDGESEGKVRHLVVDLRKSAKAETAGHSGAGNGGNTDHDGGSSSKQSSFHNVMELKAPENFEKLSQARQTEILTSKMRSELNQEIVRQTRFIISSDTKGEIRMVLKPEHLGNIRIKINLEDNHIAGKILVENNIVKQAIEQNMRHLQEAFRQSGFESAAMDVSVEDRNAGRNHDGKQQKQHFVSAVNNVQSARAAAFETLGHNSLIDLTA